MDEEIVTIFCRLVLLSQRQFLTSAKYVENNRINSACQYFDVTVSSDSSCAAA